MTSYDDFGEGLMAVGLAQREVARVLAEVIERGVAKLADQAVMFGAALAR
jgi:hypothetical protein